MRKLTIKDIQILASLKGGRCLSLEYKNSKEKLRWKCAEGHEWEALFSNIKHKESWCPTCSRTEKLTIKQMQEIAISKNGKCLSKRYINAHTKLEWKCAEGHKWKATPSNVRNNGRWCIKCARRQKLDMEEMHALASKHGGKCISKVYSNNSTKLTWQCAAGHEWEAQPSTIKYKKAWCPVCSGNKKLTIEEMYTLAESRGGKCLSTEYINSSTKLLWQCAKEHKWEAGPNNIRQGQWCPECRGSKKLTIENMQTIAISRGGNCLSTEYKGLKVALSWQCSKGHEWNATPNNIKNNKQWCPKCGGSQRLTIEDMHKLAASRGGQCLSQVYTNVSTKLVWLCSEGHKWKAIPKNIRIGRWCKICSKRKKHTIYDMYALAASRGGTCLSTEYKNAHSVLQWKCSEGHAWRTTPNNINNNGQWCPQCASGLGERICRTFFEQLLNSKFPSVWPQWLKTKTGNKRQLDGYSEECKIAFEHQGSQHYKYSSKFHRDKSCFEESKIRDLQKIKTCQEHGILLIQVPSVLEILGVENLKNLIRKRLEDNNYPLPSGFDEKKVILTEAYSPNYLKAIRHIIENKEGKLLSEVYLGAKSKVHVQCKRGHEWQVTPNDLNRGNWCPECKKINARARKKQL